MPSVLAMAHTPSPSPSKAAPAFSCHPSVEGLPNLPRNRAAAGPAFTLSRITSAIKRIEEYTRDHAYSWLRKPPNLVSEMSVMRRIHDGVLRGLTKEGNCVAPSKVLALKPSEHMRPFI